MYYYLFFCVNKVIGLYIVIIYNDKGLCKMLLDFIDNISKNRFLMVFFNCRRDWRLEDLIFICVLFV